MNTLTKMTIGLLIFYTAGFFAMDRANNALNQYNERVNKRAFFVQRAMNTINNQNESREKQGLPRLTPEEMCVIFETRESDSEKQI